MFAFAGKYIIEAELVCRTGLHIGGLQEGYEIGGMDNPVAKTPTALTVNRASETYEVPAECPYIPGSSLKGKLRSLMEWAEAKVKVEPKQDEKSGGYKAEPHTCNEAKCPVCVIFGSPASETTTQGPTRLSVLDAFPTKETIDSWEKQLGKGIFTEIKMENVIDRLTSQANPRQMERVPAGSRFHVTMIYDLYDEQNDKEMLKKLFQALRLLEDSYLGGSGTRGSGRVVFGKFRVTHRTLNYYKEQEAEKTVLEGKTLDEVLTGFNNFFCKKGAE